MGGGYTFPKVISPKVDVLEFELFYYEFAAEHVNHYATEKNDRRKLEKMGKFSFLCGKKVKNCFWVEKMQKKRKKCRKNGKNAEKTEKMQKKAPKKMQKKMEKIRGKLFLKNEKMQKKWGKEWKKRRKNIEKNAT